MGWSERVFLKKRITHQTARKSVKRKRKRTWENGFSRDVADLEIVGQPKSKSNFLDEPKHDDLCNRNFTEQHREQQFVTIKRLEKKCTHVRLDLKKRAHSAEVKKRKIHEKIHSQLKSGSQKANPCSVRTLKRN